MNGIHDMGGMENFGPLPIEKDEPLFHAGWERTIFSHAIAMLGPGYMNLDELRRATERIPPAKYLSMTYYEGWMAAIITMLEEKAMVSAEELAAGRSLRETPLAERSLTKEMAMYAIYQRIPSNVDVDIPARFRPGEKVLTRNTHTWRHTRIPRYARGRRGRIEKDYGVFLLPDANAHGGPNRPQHVYNVHFSARELWGDDASERDGVYLDLWEEYLEAHTS